MLNGDSSVVYEEDVQEVLTDEVCIDDGAELSSPVISTRERPKNGLSVREPMAFFASGSGQGTLFGDGVASLSGEVVGS